MAKMSMFAKKGKAYGLIMPSGKKTGAAKPIQKPSAFGDSSSSDEDLEVSMKKHVNATLKREHEKSKRQMEEAASQALAEDPSIFEYDSLYDQMIEEKKKKVQNLSSSRKPKYIHALKKAAERRKLEGELVYEHQAQKEIEKDSEEFRDKESFVTSAYKKKLEERRELEEELAREAAVEAANDVTKQKDLSRFQKHLFNVVASTETPVTTTEKERKDREPNAVSVNKERERDSGRSRDDSERRRRDEQRERRRSSSMTEGRERRRSSSDGRKERERQRYNDSEKGRERNEREQRYRERRRSSGGETEQQTTARDREKREISGDKERKERTPEQEANTQILSVDNQPPKDSLKTEEEPPKKKIKIKAGFEVEDDEVSSVDRRKIAATKKATTETTLSARERYLARKRVKTNSESRKPSTSE